MVATANLTTTVRAQDQVSGPLGKATDETLRFANAELEAAKKSEQASDSLGKSKGSQLAASKQVSLAIQQEAAAGSPLKQRLAELDQAHAQLKLRMRDLVKAGKPIPPQMAKAAAETQKAATKLRAHAKAARSSAKAVSGSPSGTGTGGLIGSLKTAALGYVALGAVVTQAASAAKDMIREQIRLGEELNKQSIKLGVSIEALQELKFAAVSAGVSNDQMSNTLSKLNKAMGEAASGGKAYQDAFDEIGVSVFDAEGRMKTLEQILPELADGLADTADQGTKASVSAKLLGRAGIDLLPVLDGGSEGLAQMAARARELGGVMSTETALAADAAEQSFADLDFAVEGMEQRFSADAIPAVEAINTALAAGVGFINNSEIAFGLLKDAIATLAGPVGFIVDQFGELADVLSESDDGMREIRESARELEKEREQEARAEAARARAAKLRSEKRARESEQASKRIIKARENEAREKERIAKAELAAALTHIDTLAAAEAAAISRDLEMRNSIAAALNEQKQERLDKEKEASAEALSVAETEAQDRINLGLQMGATLGQVFVDLASGQKKAGDVIVGVFNKILSQAIEVATQFIAMEAAKASAAALSAHAGIPFAGLAIGLGAAGAIVTALLSMAKFQHGGLVTGGRRGQDSVPALLTPGEVVLPVGIVEAITRTMGAGPRRGAALGFANGGMVPAAAPGGMTIVVSPTFQSLELPSRAQADRVVRDAILPALRTLNQQGHKI